MYIIGFCDALLGMLGEYIDGFDWISGSKINDVRWIGCITLVCILALAIVGMDWVTRVMLEFVINFSLIIFRILIIYSA